MESALEELWRTDESAVLTLLPQLCDTLVLGSSALTQPDRLVLHRRAFARAVPGSAPEPNATLVPKVGSSTDTTLALISILGFARSCVLNVV
eukprot:6174097-Pleurochrysis_carterae.AAC.1